MEWFLDMCILISYANPSEKMSGKTRDFVKRKQNKIFVVCNYIVNKNLPSWIEREKIALREIKKYFDDSYYIIGSSEEGKKLLKQDITDAKKLANISIKTAGDKEKAFRLLKLNQEILIKSLNYFMDKFIDKKVIPIEKIDDNLRSSLFSYLSPNDSDARTLASGIQYHQEENVNLLTDDESHWTNDLLNDAVVLHPSLNKKYKKIPEIIYLSNV